MNAARKDIGLMPYMGIILGTILVYVNPRSNIAFLTLITSFFSLYSLGTSNRFKLITGIVLALFIIPVIGVRNIFYLEIIFQISVFAALALGLNIVVGFAGLLDLGYVAFYAVGAYICFTPSNIMFSRLHPVPNPPTPPFASRRRFLPVPLHCQHHRRADRSCWVAGLAPAGDYLAIVTLLLVGDPRWQTTRQAAELHEWTWGYTHSASILATTLWMALMPYSSVVGHPVDGFIQRSSILAPGHHCHHQCDPPPDDSKIGRAWTAIREDETAAIAMGVPLVKMKLAAFAVGASFAGVMGVLLAASRTFVSPESFSFMQSIGVLSMVILGGQGSIPGVILGAATVIILNLQILQGFSLYLSQLRQSDAVIPIINFAWRDLSPQLDPAKYQRLLFGLILILMMIFRPSGLIPAERRKRALAADKLPDEEE
jgi:branched-chain amino acid transport system permease protein